MRDQDLMTGNPIICSMGCPPPRFTHASSSRCWQESCLAASMLKVRRELPEEFETLFLPERGAGKVQPHAPHP